MGTRCGSIDPSIVPYMMKKTGMTPDEIDNAMNKQSGLLGLSGVSSDAREIWDAVAAGNERAKLSMDVLTYRIKKIVGSFAAALNGVDVIVFTAGLGENDARARNLIATNMEWLGIQINEEYNLNAPRGQVVELTAEGSKTRVFILPTDEELMIAKDTERLAIDFYA